uniref:uncharacterized protein LOC122594546 n=1 Tax=Erigeron canadensis TaxID=72917 RepID=UPI001CB952E2|nr:uncharacterized protein LOC122594546 [Erigeron canadensis]
MTKLDHSPTLHLNMPQLDFESLPSICTDRKIACDPDTLDYPPESFWLSKDAEFDWFDRNAFLDRNESIKGNSNSINLNSNTKNIHFLKPKGNNINILLPNAQKTRRNCRLANILLFPKRLNSLSKETTSMAEPMSPKVSCLGRVRSKGCTRGQTSTPQNEKETPDSQHHDKTGFVWCVKWLFGSNCYNPRKSKKLTVEVNQVSEYSAPRRPAIDSA